MRRQRIEETQELEETEETEDEETEETEETEVSDFRNGATERTKGTDPRSDGGAGRTAGWRAR